MNDTETSLFDLPETLSPRESWIRQNNIIITRDPESHTPWTATGKGEASAGETRDQALAMLAHKLIRSGVAHWVAPMKGGAE